MNSGSLPTDNLEISFSGIYKNNDDKYVSLVNVVVDIDHDVLIDNPSNLIRSTKKILSNDDIYLTKLFNYIFSI